MKTSAPTKWDERFLQLAQLISSWSKDTSTKVGSVIVRPDRTIAALGFNGFPRGIEDRIDRIADKGFKHNVILHAEENALLSRTETVRGYVLYTWPVIPCSRCAAQIIQAGIVRVVSKQGRSGGSVLNYDLTQALFIEAGVIFDVYE